MFSKRKFTNSDPLHEVNIQKLVDKLTLSIIIVVLLIGFCSAVLITYHLTAKSMAQHCTEEYYNDK